MQNFVLILFLLLSCPAFAANPGSCEKALTSVKTSIQKVWDLFFGFTNNPLPRPMPVPPGVPSPKPSPKPSKQEPKEDYTAHNKNTDTPPSAEATEIVSSLNRSHVVYFAERHFLRVNAATANLRSEDRGGQLLPVRADSGGLQLTVHPLHLSTDRGYLMIPFGFTPVSVSASGLNLELRKQGLYYNRTSLDPVSIRLIATPPQKIEGQDWIELTTVLQPPALQSYPEEWQKFLLDLLARQSSLKPLAVAEEVRDFIQKTLKYEVDASPEKGVLPLCQRGSAQCDGATLIFVSILRSVFKIPSLPVGGILSAASAEDPDVSLILNQAQPHMFAAVYDPLTEKFVVMDPTPGDPTREKDNPPKEDPRFKDWPKPGVPGAEEAKKREERKVEHLWRQLFSKAQSPSWASSLWALEQELSLAQAQQGLSPELENMYRNVIYISELTKLNPPTSLSIMARDLEQAPTADLHLKKEYIQLQILSRLSAYGTQYAAAANVYERLGNATQAMLDSVPAATALSVAADLLAKLPGDFSREDLLSSRPHTPLLRQLIALRDHVHLASIKEFQLMPSLYYDKSYQPTEIDDFDYETAEDFEHMQNFERGALPTKYDFIRVANEDMQLRIYKDPIQRQVSSPKKNPGGREVTFFLFDLSGSMQNNLKGIVRDRLMQLWLDQIFSQNSQAMVQLLGYRNAPEAAVILNSYEQAKAQFKRMMVSGEYFKSKDGNNTAVAFARAIEIAKQLGSEYRKINFRLITDGEETLDMRIFRDAKDQLGAQTELNLTAVTLIAGNSELREFVEKSADANLLKDGHFVHLSEAEIQSIMATQDHATEERMTRYLPENYRLLQNAPGYLRSTAAGLAPQL